MTNRIDVTPRAALDNSAPYPVPVFVYGTLRRGEGNYSWAQNAVISEVQGVTARGTLWMPEHRGFPYATFDRDARGLIRGDILIMDLTHPLFMQVVKMELGAGYQMITTSVNLPEGVTLASGDNEYDRRQLTCVAFHVSKRFARDRGGRAIRSGDWFEALGAYTG